MAMLLSSAAELEAVAEASACMACGSCGGSASSSDGPLLDAWESSSGEEVLEDDEELDAASLSSEDELGAASSGLDNTKV